GFRLGALTCQLGHCLWPSDGRRLTDRGACQHRQRKQGKKQSVANDFHGPSPKGKYPAFSQRSQVTQTQRGIFFASLVAPADTEAGSPSAFFNAASSFSLPQSFRISLNLERVRSERTHPRGGLTATPSLIRDSSHIARCEKCGASRATFA